MARLASEAIQYPDMPAHGHNRDSVAYRILNAAWNALHKCEVTDLSFAELAREASVTTGAIYPYFPTINALVGDLIDLGFRTLFKELGSRFHPVFSTPSGRHRVRAFISDFLRFAERRPRHCALMLSKQYEHPDRFPAVVAHRRNFRLHVLEMLELELLHVPTPEEFFAFWTILVGNVSLASGPNRRKRKVAFALVERFFDEHRARAAAPASEASAPH